MIELHQVSFTTDTTVRSFDDYLCKSCINELPNFFWPNEYFFDPDNHNTIIASHCPNCGSTDEKGE